MSANHLANHKDPTRNAKAF